MNFLGHVSIYGFLGLPIVPVSVTLSRVNKQNLTISLLLGALLLTGCQTIPKSVEKVAVSEPVKVQPKPLPFKEPKKVVLELDEDLVYSYLLAEIAARRGDLKTALAHYLYAALLADDPYAAERATRIATHIKDYQQGLRAVRRWVELAPNALAARQLSTILFLRNGDIEGSQKQLVALLEIAEALGRDGFILAANALNTEQDKTAVLSLLNYLAELYPNDHRAYYALAIVQSRHQRYKEADSSLRKAIKLKPTRSLSHVLLSRVLISQGRRDQALEHLSRAVADYPTDKVLRTSYARQLVSAEQLEPALEQFRELHRQSPDDAQVTYGLAMLTTQEEHWEEARSLWQGLRNNPKFMLEASYFLAQVEELTKHVEEAIGLYASVNEGELRVDAAIRRASLLARNGRLGEAQDVLQQTRVSNASRAIDIYLAETLLLQELDVDKHQILDLYATAIKAYPESNELLYNRGLYLADIGDIVAMEADFKAVLVRDENHVNALNALGYTLADKGLRLEEAYLYVKRALKLMPDNAAILDSMGWVSYRMGDLVNAVKYLRAAVKQEADDEIAAHLGEVLWVSGEQGEAEDIWQKALHEKPESDLLKAIIKRFKVNP